MKKNKVSFLLPPKGVLTPNGRYDPLPSYYQPIIGYFYCKRIKQALSLLTPPYKSILEIGYGSGILIPTLYSISNDIVGVDKLSDPKIVKSNLERMNCRPLLMKELAHNINFPENRFELVVSIGTFEHILLNKIEILLEKIFKILVPGGHLLVGMPQINKIMNKSLSIIGYPGIEEHHVTGHEDFINAARNHFKLIRYIRLPSLLPKFAAIYHSMLFCKPG